MEATETETEAKPELTKLHPDHVKVTRIVAALWIVILFVPAVSMILLTPGIAELVRAIRDLSYILMWVSLLLPAILPVFLFVFWMPKRRYLHRGYNMGSDRIRIVRGYLFHSDTIVPFGRIQHIDVDQGPIQRRYDLATLTVHTAGNHNSQVSLPGLLHQDAIAMREEIRSHIGRAAA